MKKHWISVILLLLCCSLLLVACEKKQEDTDHTNNDAHDYSGLDDLIYNISDGTITQEYPWDQIPFQRESAAPTVTVEFCGQAYTGTYQNSCERLHDSFITDYYMTEDGINFSTRADTGTLLEISLMDNEYQNREYRLDDVADPRQFAIDRAKEVAAEYVSIDDYYLASVKSSPYTTRIDFVKYEMTVYYVTYAKFINGFETYDYVSVEVTSKGSVTRLDIGDVGAFDDLTTEISVDEVTAAVDALIPEIAKNGKRHYISHEAAPRWLIQLPDGRHAAGYSITASLRTLGGEDFRHSFFLLVTFE